MKTSPPASRLIAVWLLVGCVLIAATLVVGGMTRLTGSGLSMVDWEPVAGVIPPLTDAAWEDEFAAYRDSPEYLLVNQGLTLSGFKRIFWFEYIHRLLGRVIGIVFLIPFAFFWWRGAIPRSMFPRLLAIFALGGAQGLLGWWMVQSGLVDQPHVSQYRLTAHLGLAVLVYGVTLWTALTVIRPGPEGVPKWWAESRAGVRTTARTPLTRLATGVFVAACLTLLSGGLVAGLDAGLMFNTFPKMDGSWVPSTLYAGGLWNGLFEDRLTVQFNHRILALALAAGTTLLWARCARSAGPTARRWAHASFVAVWVQAGLGVATLLLVVPVGLASLHQANALVLLTTLLVLAYELRHD